MFGQIYIKPIKCMKNIYEYVVKSPKKRKYVQHEIRRLIREYNIKHTHCEYVRAIGNAIHYGKCPITIKVYHSKSNDFVCTIYDSGDGFNYKEVIKKFNDGKKYYHNHGLGTKSYARNAYLKVDWDHAGRRIILDYLNH